MLVCMRTNIVIDDELIAEAMKLAGTNTKRETVDTALRELVAQHRRMSILELEGAFPEFPSIEELRHEEGRDWSL
jgi:Arc/MetJ family transcription regulator